MLPLWVNGYITVFTLLIHISVIHRNLYYFTFIFQSVFFFCAFFHMLVFLQLVYLYGYNFSQGKDHTHTLNTMTVKYPCLVCNRVVTKNHEAVQFDCCDRWVHNACNYLNVHTYRKLQKDKSQWYCLCCL